MFTIHCKDGQIFGESMAGWVVVDESTAQSIAVANNFGAAPEKFAKFYDGVELDCYSHNLKIHKKKPIPEEQKLPPKGKMAFDHVISWNGQDYRVIGQPGTFKYDVYKLLTPGDPINKAGGHYVVTHGDINWIGATCSCPIGKFSHKQCKHYEIVGEAVALHAGLNAIKFGKMYGSGLAQLPPIFGGSVGGGKTTFISNIENKVKEAQTSALQKIWATIFKAVPEYATLAPEDYIISQEWTDNQTGSFGYMRLRAIVAATEKELWSATMQPAGLLNPSPLEWDIVVWGPGWKKQMSTNKPTVIHQGNVDYDPGVTTTSEPASVAGQLTKLDVETLQELPKPKYDPNGAEFPLKAVFVTANPTNDKIKAFKKSWDLAMKTAGPWKQPILDGGATMKILHDGETFGEYNVHDIKITGPTTPKVEESHTADPELDALGF